MEHFRTFSDFSKKSKITPNARNTRPEYLFFICLFLLKISFFVCVGNIVILALSAAGSLYQYHRQMRGASMGTWSIVCLVVPDAYACSAWRFRPSLCFTHTACWDLCDRTIEERSRGLKPWLRCLPHDFGPEGAAGDDGGRSSPPTGDRREEPKL